MNGHAVHILSVHKQRTIRHIIGTKQQIYYRSLTRTGFAYNTDTFTGSYLKADVLQYIIIAVRIAERQMPEFNTAFWIFKISYTIPVRHIYRRIHQLRNTIQGSLTTGSLFNQHRNRHDRPDDGFKVADVFHQLSGVEFSTKHQPAAVA